MHDPLTVAFDIAIPMFWKKRETYGRSRLHLITIWHKDPELDGSDDSCDWFSKRWNRANGWYPVHHDAFRQLSPEAQEAVHFIWYAFGHKLRRFRIPPRWHVHHWQIQIHHLQQLKRWLFSRCRECGGRFTWQQAGGCVAGYGPDNSKGPGWFCNAERIAHFACRDATESKAPPKPQAEPRHELQLVP